MNKLKGRKRERRERRERGREERRKGTVYVPCYSVFSLLASFLLQSLGGFGLFVFSIFYGPYKAGSKFFANSLWCFRRGIVLRGSFPDV